MNPVCRRINPCTYIESFGHWLGRKVRVDVDRSTAIVNFIKGVACFPVIHIGNKIVRHIFLPISSAEFICPEEMVKEVANFSYAQKVSAPICFFIITIGQGILEEFFFRQGFQEGLTEYLTNRFPQHAEFLQSKKFKCIKVALSTALFCGVHLLNSVEYPLRILPLGLVASILQEKYGLSAAIGAHVANNCVGFAEMLPNIMKCYFSP